MLRLVVEVEVILAVYYLLRVLNFSIWPLVSILCRWARFNRVKTRCGRPPGTKLIFLSGRRRLVVSTKVQQRRILLANVFTTVADTLVLLRCCSSTWFQSSSGLDEEDAAGPLG